MPNRQVSRPCIKVCQINYQNIKRLTQPLSVRRCKWAFIGYDTLVHRKIAQQIREHSPRADQLPLSIRFHQVSQELQQPFIDYLFRIGKEQDNLKWWSTTLSWRNAYVSPSFKQVCYLKIAIELVEQWDATQDLILVCAEPIFSALINNLDNLGIEHQRISNPSAMARLRWLTDKFNLVAHRIFFVLNETYRILQTRRSLPYPRLPSKPTVFLISWVTSANWREGNHFHSSFFGELVSLMEEMGLNVVAIPMVLKDVPYNQALTQLISSSTPVLPPHSSLGLFDPLKAAIKSIGSESTNFSPLNNMQIECILRDELRRDRITNNSAHAMLLESMVKRWAQNEWLIDRIIYIFENQPWEKAVCLAARQALPKTFLIGYQPTPVPKLLLNFGLAQGEHSVAPLPNRVVTVGRHSAQALLSKGYPPNSVSVGGALQLAHLLESTSSDATTVPDRPGRPVVLFASSAGFEETLELLLLAIDLFDGSEGVQVVLKCHPIMSYDRVNEYLQEPLPEHVKVSNEPIQDLINESSLMVYSGSTVCIQALALKLPVIHVRPRMDFDLDPLEDSPNLRLDARDIQELRLKVKWLLNNREQYIQMKHRAWAEFISESYSVVTEDTLRSFLN